MGGNEVISKGSRGWVRASTSRRGASVLAGGVLIALAVLALVSPAGANTITPTCPIPAEGTPSQAAPSAGFLSLLGELRRPKAPTDELPVTAGFPKYPLLGGGIDVNYIRRAQVVAGTSYYLIPVQHPLRVVRCNAPEELFLYSITPDGSRSGGGSTASNIEHGRSFGTRWTSSGATISGIVPDGVAEVTAIYRVNRRHRVSVTMNAINNVFVTTVPRQLFPQPLPEMPTKVIWHATNGARIRTIDIQH